MLYYRRWKDQVQSEIYISGESTPVFNRPFLPRLFSPSATLVCHSHSSPCLLKFAYLNILWSRLLPLLQETLPPAHCLDRSRPLGSSNFLNSPFECVRPTSRHLQIGTILTMEAINGHNKACCNVPPVVCSDYVAKGSYSQLGGLETCQSPFRLSSFFLLS